MKSAASHVHYAPATHTHTHRRTPGIPEIAMHALDALISPSGNSFRYNMDPYKVTGEYVGMAEEGGATGTRHEKNPNW